MKRKRIAYYVLIGFVTGMTAYNVSVALTNSSNATHLTSSIKTLATETVSAENSTNPNWVTGLELGEKEIESGSRWYTTSWTGITFCIPRYTKIPCCVGSARVNACDKSKEDSRC